MTSGTATCKAQRPDEGHRFNPHKLLLDPYARDIVGAFEWNDRHFTFDRQNPTRMDHRDNATLALKARVVDENFDWDADHSSRIAPADTVIYEAHVKGCSQLNPQIPEPLRGTYAGLAHAASIANLKGLGVTSLCLLPVHLYLDEERLVAMGLRNHWGYNTLGFFCVEPRYASGTGGLSPRDEFKTMMKALHAAGFEVLLDVVSTTPPSPTRPDRPSVFAVSTTPATTGCHPIHASTTRTMPAAATRSTSGNPRCCNW